MNFIEKIVKQHVLLLRDIPTAATTAPVDTGADKQHADRAPRDVRGAETASGDAVAPSRCKNLARGDGRQPRPAPSGVTNPPHPFIVNKETIL